MPETHFITALDVLFPRGNRLFGAAGQHGEQVVEIVRDTSGKLAHCLHFLGVDEFRLTDLFGRQVPDHGCKDTVMIKLRLADRQVERYARTIFCEPFDFPACADYLRQTGFQVVLDVAVML